jgi:hypothetical protein
LLDWLGDLDRADKLVPDLVLYGFSILGFAFLPGRLGRWVWGLLAWFLVVNVLFLMNLWDAFEWHRPWLFAALGQLPWLLVILDLGFRGRLSIIAAAVPMRDFLLWHTTRIMGVHFILAIYGGYAPEEFGLEVGFSEALTGLGALALFFLYRPGRPWFRTLLIFWNTYGLTSAVAAQYRILFSNPELPFARYSREIFHYAGAYPQNWAYCFWFPLAISLHAALFYKMYLNRTKPWV